MTAQSRPEPVDLFIIGGGINGCGIARDAVGRGLSVVLAEQGDLAQGTSSASTKLFHGGLRYLEYFEFRLVREALREREVLLRAMPHIAWPMRFVLPLHDDMRFETETPAGQMLARIMPWLRGRRPDWMIRLGLFLYDHMGGRKILPATRRIDLRRDPAGEPLLPKYRKAYEYSDVWVDDARLVVLNARAARDLGAQIMTWARVTGAVREGALWAVTVGDEVLYARALVNAAGPWVSDMAQSAVPTQERANIRLVRGSHIVLRKVFEHDRAYFFQGSDGRIIFAIPYEDDFTLIGTTDMAHGGPDERPECSAQEEAYLLAFAQEYFAAPIGVEDIVWRYSGVRPLFDDGETSATAATRDYVVKVEAEGAPLVTIYGGKITTYRRLAETALAKLGKVLPGVGAAWTAGAPLPGGDFEVWGYDDLVRQAALDYPFLERGVLDRLVSAYGTEVETVLGPAVQSDHLGQYFGGGLYEAEVRWLMAQEWAQTAEDVVWRRSKLGLRMSAQEIAALEAWMRARWNRAVAV